MVQVLSCGVKNLKISLAFVVSFCDYPLSWVPHRRVSLHESLAS